MLSRTRVARAMASRPSSPVTRGVAPVWRQRTKCCNSRVSWSPPLILTKENVDVALEIFDEAIAASIERENFQKPDREGGPDR